MQALAFTHDIARKMHGDFPAVAVAFNAQYYSIL